MATVAAERVVQQADRHPFGRGGERAFHVIAVPLDGSEHARVALGPARALARRLGAEIVLVRVATQAHVPGVDQDLASRLGETDALVDLNTEVQRLRVKGFAAREVTVGDSEVAPADGIIAAVRAAGADLVVMATHGRTGLARAILGSVAGEVVKRAPVPVLLVRPVLPGHEHGVAGALGTSGVTSDALDALRFLVAVDGSAESEAALPSVARLAIALDASISLVRVLSSGGSIFGAGSGAEAHDVAARGVQRAALRLQELGMPAGSVRGAVRTGKVAGALLDQAAREQADVLVMAPHPRGPLSLGSTTATVVARTKLPVLVIRTTSG